MNTNDIVSNAEIDEDEVSSGKIDPNLASQIVVSSTDWTVETILSQLSRSQIDINPRFQRRDAWDAKRKSRFIESLILGLPVPQLVLAERKDARGQYIVLDGKQRLLTILQFNGKASYSNYNAFKLTALDVRSDLNGKSYQQLYDNSVNYQDIVAFSNQTIRTVVVRNWPNDDFLNLMFLRLNTGSVALSPQELRQALLPGPFVDYVDDWASSSAPLQRLLKISEPDFRMRDIEVVIRYLGFAMLIERYSGNMKAFLDMTCSYLNENWDSVEVNVKGKCEQLDIALTESEGIFGAGHVGRKWFFNDFQTPLNRAVLDVIVYYFGDPDILKQSVANKDQVLAAFKLLCDNNTSFQMSIELSTNNLRATKTRFELWGQALSVAIGQELSIPQINRASQHSGLE